MERQFYGPFWPLGHIDVAYRGDGQVLTANLTDVVETTEYFEAAALALIISPCRNAGSTFADNTGRIYLCMQSPVGTYDSFGYPDTVICAITPTAGVVQIPQAQYGSSRYKLNELGIDSDVNGDGAFVCAIMQ
jgi:hypothetical protein